MLPAKLRHSEHLTYHHDRLQRIFSSQTTVSGAASWLVHLEKFRLKFLIPIIGNVSQSSSSIISLVSL